MDETYLNFAFNTLFENYGRSVSDTEMADIANHNGIDYPIEHHRILLHLYRDEYSNSETTEPLLVFKKVL
ncbi:hypothetical protein [Segetibacter koreensis]|uniref:hypothetical protein n=1 Tax=Segetibacter koreensis TaxID=398037 RepID=UPI000363D2A5|nr:hypothetical protein [Segetibacter koreensis]